MALLLTYRYRGRNRGSQSRSLSMLGASCRQSGRFASADRDCDSDPGGLWSSSCFRIRAPAS